MPSLDWTRPFFDTQTHQKSSFHMPSEFTQTQKTSSNPPFSLAGDHGRPSIPISSDSEDSSPVGAVGAASSRGVLGVFALKLQGPFLHISHEMFYSLLHRPRKMSDLPFGRSIRWGVRSGPSGERCFAASKAGNDRKQHVLWKWNTTWLYGSEVSVNKRKQHDFSFIHFPETHIEVDKMTPWKTMFLYKQGGCPFPRLFQREYVYTNGLFIASLCTLPQAQKHRARHLLPQKRIREV